MSIKTGLKKVLIYAKENNRTTPVKYITNHNLIDADLIMSLEDEGLLHTYYQDGTRIMVLTLKGYKQFKEAN